MFVREKTARGHRYLYLVESVRDGGRVRQQIVRALGRKDVLLASGELDRLVASLARHSERVMILTEMEAGRLSCTRIGGPLLFGRLWECLGIADVLADRLRGRGFDFAVERAVFVAVLHRLFVSGSDRACEKWMADYAIPGSDGLQLHHFYRAMAWLGEEMGPIADGELAPRCIKDVIEEQLFERRRDLFSELSVVFMDTTTLSFAGEGWRGAGRPRPFQGPPAGPQTDGAGRRPRRRGAAALHGDAAGEHSRRQRAAADRLPVARPLRRRRGVRRCRPRHDLDGHHSGPRRAPAR